MATVFAFLEDCGYRRDEIGQLTRGYVRRVLQHARDEDGRLVIPRPAGPTYAEQCRDLLFRRHCPPWAVEAKVREWSEARDARRARKEQKRGKPKA